MGKKAGNGKIRLKGEAAAGIEPASKALQALVNTN
jgi:hypothetical protein